MMYQRLLFVILLIGLASVDRVIAARRSSRRSSSSSSRTSTASTSSTRLNSNNRQSNRGNNDRTRAVIAGQQIRNRMRHRIRAKAAHQRRGAAIKFCPGGSECKQYLVMNLKRLREVDTDGNDVNNHPQKFEENDFEWSSPIDEVEGDVNRTKVEFNARIKIGASESMTSLRFTTYIYHTNGTSQNANQTLEIPENSLKFSLNITDWPWKSSNNSLQFGVRLHIVTRNGNWTRGGRLSRRKKGANGRIERVEFDDGVFLEVPEICDADGSPKAVNTTINPTEKEGLDMDWVFPHFSEYLYYDPVFGSDAPAEYEEEALPTTSKMSNTATLVPSLTLASLTASLALVSFG